MGRFVNSKTGVVVSVADDKDERFAAPLWRAYDGSAAEGDEAVKAAVAGKRRTGAARAGK